MTGEASVAAATAVVGYDLFTGKVWAISSRPRIWRGFALCGSAAGGDTAVDLMVGATKVGEKYNNTTGFATRDHLVPVGRLVPPGEAIHALVTDAAATNPINALVDIEDL